MTKLVYVVIVQPLTSCLLIIALWASCVCADWLYLLHFLWNLNGRYR